MQVPETRYADGPDGLIAYKVRGTGRDIVWMTGMTTHVDFVWEPEEIRDPAIRVATFGRLIHFDRRGNGASDPLPIDSLPTWEEWSEDLSLVLAAVQSDRATLIGQLDAGPMAMLFAAAHPERIESLVLVNTAPRLIRSDDYPIGITLEEAEALHTFFRDSWGTEEFIEATFPSLANDAPTKTRLARGQRASASPRFAAAHFRSLFELDIRRVLGSITAPTLILHNRRFPIVPIEHAHYLHEHIANSTLLEIDSADAGIARDARALDAIEEFVTGAAPSRASDRVLATTLFTDVVGSTSQASELGDRRWKHLLDQHDELIRSQIERHGGTLIKTTGDGSLATFDAPTRAILCAQAIVSGLHGLGLRVRAGLHTGEIELRGDDVAGLAVVISERVSSLADAGQVLVSSTVKDLVVGSDVAFDDRGTHDLRGVPDRWRIFAVR